MIDFHDVSSKDFLKHLSLIFVCREPERGCHHIPFLEPARGQITQHRAHKLVAELGAAQLTKYDVALLHLSRLTLRRLYVEGFALPYHF